MTAEELIKEIHQAFKNVKLEDGIGIWEAQAIDDYCTLAERLEIKKKDKRNDWSQIPYEEIAYCESSLSFFDAKGMRFCLPQYLICDLSDGELLKDQDLSAPDVLFTLSHDLDDDYQKERFSLFSKEQIACVIEFLDLKLNQEEYLNDTYFQQSWIDAREWWKAKLISLV